MSKTYTTLSREGYTYLIGLIRNLANVSEGIDDLHLLSNGTFSSVKIDTLLNTLRSDCNEYTDRLVANLSRLELKIANDESEISQPNIMYLYKASGETSYSQYVVIEGTKILLGTCDIDMGNYYTITQADAKFVLKTDFDSLKTEVERKVNKTDIIDNLTSTDTDKPLSANQGKILDDKKLNKADISTIIDSSSTDDKVPSEKAVYDNIKNKNTMQPSGTLTNYSSVLDWAINNIGATCPYEGNNFDDHPMNYTWGTLVCMGTNIDSGLKVLVYRNDSKVIYTRTIQNGNGGKWVEPSWQILCTTTVADVPKTNITPADTTKFVGFKGNSMCNYCVQNGICYVSLWGVQVTVTGRVNTGVILPLPKSGFFGGGYLTGGGDAITHAYAHTIPETGELKFNVKDANTALYGSFSYPVAES